MTPAVAAPERAALAVVTYRCRVVKCNARFGDPDVARDYQLWAMQVQAHLGGVHGITLQVHDRINDWLVPEYAKADGVEYFRRRYAGVE